MASNYTPNVGLCQWQRTDPFTLDDFNADNAKIDAALAAQPYQVLLTQTFAAEAEGLSLDVSGLDLSATPRLRVEITAPFYTVNNNHTTIGIQANSLASGYHYIANYEGANASDNRPYIYAGAVRNTQGGDGMLSWTVELLIPSRGFAAISHVLAIDRTAVGGHNGYNFYGYYGCHETLERSQLETLWFGRVNLSSSNTDIAFLPGSRAVLIALP